MEKNCVVSGERTWKKRASAQLCHMHGQFSIKAAPRNLQKPFSDTSCGPVDIMGWMIQHIWACCCDIANFSQHFQISNWIFFGSVSGVLTTPKCAWSFLIVLLAVLSLVVSLASAKVPWFLRALMACHKASFGQICTCLCCKQSVW